nr:SIMPL domain-containing protein [Acidobacteriota bacterium]
MRTTILIAVLAAASSLPALAQPPPPGGPPRDVVVSSGQGLVKRAPDQVFVTVAAEARSRQPREAQQQNATVMTAVRARLAAFALAEDAIRTLSVDMQPEFDWANGKQTLRGYLASNVIDVRLDDVARVGEVVDAVVAAGA